MTFFDLKKGDELCLAVPPVMKISLAWVYSASPSISLLWAPPASLHKSPSSESLIVLARHPQRPRRRRNFSFSSLRSLFCACSSCLSYFVLFRLSLALFLFLRLVYCALGRSLRIDFRPTMVTSFRSTLKLPTIWISATESKGYLLSFAPFNIMSFLIYSSVHYSGGPINWKPRGKFSSTC